jgi:hypothetical protein
MMLLPFLRWPMHRRHGRSGRLRWLAMLAPFILLFGYIVSGFLGVPFDSPWAADHDGIACEPWNGRNASGVKVHRYWRTGR